MNEQEDEHELSEAEEREAQIVAAEMGYDRYLETEHERIDKFLSDFVQVETKNHKSFFHHRDIHLWKHIAATAQFRVSVLQQQEQEKEEAE